MIPMPWTISAGLYLKSVQTCGKSTNLWSSTLLLRLLAWKMRLLSGSIIFWGESWTQLDSRFVFNDSLHVEFSSIFWHLIIGYKFFCIAAALEILRQMSSQYLQVLITFRTFVHMNQSLCTSWCFIISIKMQITWSWMKTETRRQS